jgi:hypothetical protein
VGGGDSLKRERQDYISTSRGGQECPDLIEYDHEMQESWRNQCDGQRADQDEHNKLVDLAWSECTKACGTGYQYRWREHIICSATAALQYHALFRQGRHCNTNACSSATGDSTAPESLVEELIPHDFMPVYERKIPGTWHDVHVSELDQYGLPLGHWQRYEDDDA